MSLYQALTPQQVAQKYPKPKKETKLVGVDVYVISDKGIPKFDEIPPFKCEYIANRGQKVWPDIVHPDLLLVNWYRCRFVATKALTDADAERLLSAISQNYIWSAAQKLFQYDNEPGYSG